MFYHISFLRKNIKHWGVALICLNGFIYLLHFYLNTSYWFLFTGFKLCIVYLSRINEAKYEIMYCNFISTSKNKYCMDYYDINVEIIKSVAYIIINPLSLLFNNCIDHEVFPHSFKFSKRIPIFEKGSNISVSWKLSTNFNYPASRKSFWNHFEKEISWLIWSHKQSVV